MLEVGRRRELLAIECKSASKSFDASGLKAFRGKHPRGKNIVVTLHPTDTHVKTYGDAEVEFVPYERLASRLEPLR